MKFIAIVILVAFAMGGAEECTDKRAEACSESLLSSILRNDKEEEVCRELKTSINCIREFIDDCGEQTNEEAEEGLVQLEEVHKDHCAREDDGLKQCVEANEEYIFECIYDSSTQALILLLDESNKLDDNSLKCTTYLMIARCFKKRVGEKCGEAAARLAMEEMKNLPTEIEIACEAAGGIDPHTF